LIDVFYICSYIPEEVCSHPEWDILLDEPPLHVQLIESEYEGGGVPFVEEVPILIEVE
jgi:hypothetical protein